MNDEQDPRPLDEIIAEILWRVRQLKSKAKAIQDEPSMKQRITRWLNTSNK